MKRVCMLCMIVLIHLQAFAGGSIRINTFKPLKPFISVTLQRNVARELAQSLKEKAPEVLSLHMVINDLPSDIPVNGKYHLSGQELTYTPMYELGNNLEFEVRYTENGKVSSKRFLTEVPVQTTTSLVRQFFPVADTVPVNTLFFHVRFSNSMRPDMLAYKYVKVYDAAGVEKTEAWRQKSFWLDSGRLLVLMVHPGRVKTGIDYGGALFEKGQYYTLKVSKDIKDINGNALLEDYSRKYFIGAKDTVLPVVYIDTLQLPEVGSTEPLVLQFSEGVDHASVIDGINITDNKGRIIQRDIQYNGDSKYIITPQEKWNKKPYSLVLKPAVYDFAANRLYRLFEVSDRKEFEKDQTNTVIGFRVQ